MSRRQNDHTHFMLSISLWYSHIGYTMELKFLIQKLLFCFQWFIFKLETVLLNVLYST